jgi:hypothetical protein
MAHQTLTAIVSNIQDEGLIATYGEVQNETGSFFKTFDMQDPKSEKI